MRLRKGWTRAIVFQKFCAGASIRTIAMLGVQKQYPNWQTQDLYASAHVERIIRREAKK